MAAPSDESVPLEYMASSTTRRAPKKLQGIGIGQFRKQGVAHQFHPNSAAGILHKQKAEQRMEDWLRGAPANAPQGNAKGKRKKKAKNDAKSKKNEATSSTIKDTGVEGSTDNVGTGPAVAVAQMGQGKTAGEHGKMQGDTSTAAKAPTRKRVKIVTVDRHVKPTQGAWGQRAAENAKKAALRATAPSYSTTPIIIGETDGELSATVIPQPKPPTPEPIIPRAAVAQPKSVPAESISTKTVRKSSTKPRASKKSQAPMWSDDDDDDDQEEDDLNDSLFSSHPVSSSTKQSRSRTTRNSNPHGKATRDEPTPQKKRQVRFAPTASSEEEGVEEVETTTKSNHNHNHNQTNTHQAPKPASQKQQQQQQQPYNPLHLPQAAFHIPSKPTQTPSDPANLADDEDSQILSAKKTQNAQKESTTPKTNPNPASPATPSFTQAKKRMDEQTPPRRKGVAGPPLPKRARATAEIDNDSANDSAAPASKKAKTSGEKAKAAKKDPAVRKKKGVARKVK